ncbi:MAG: hypothetical protein HOB49_28700, partial [Gemmatimonadetes bacterium]|nr:hypothetical protein [Gemmatimonadota bacterium]
MSAFVPLDLTSHFNAGSGNVALGDDYLWPWQGEDVDNTPLTGLPGGDALFWGVPFCLAAAEQDKRLIVVADAGKKVERSVTIQVDGAARRILFAHACAPTEGSWSTLDGASEDLGHYVIRYQDGSQIVQPLRRRWQIHDTDVPWGHHPFECRNCRTFHSVPIDDRHAPYGQVQVGVYSSFGRPDEPTPQGPNGHDLRGWWLFDWQNPTPDKPLIEIVVEATSKTPIALAAITLCDEEGDPFHWPSRETLAVTVEGEQAPPEVTMERGVIAHQDDLFEPQEDFLETEEAGWGRGGQTRRAGGHVEVHGSEGGTLSVGSGEEKADFRWGDVLAEGTAKDGPVQIEVVGHLGTEWVHVRVEDEDTGKPVGCRVHFRSKQGNYLAPHGHQQDVNIAWFEDMGGDCKTTGVP